MRASRSLAWALRVGVSVALIGFMLSRLDVRDMVAFVGRADVFLVMVTLVTVGMDRSLMAVRWIYLLETVGARAPRGRVVKIFFLSTFFGSFLPTGVGGDAVRAVSFSRLTSQGVEAFASVAMDRLLGMLSMLVTALASLAIFYRFFPHPALLGTVLALAVLVAGALVVLLSARLQEPIRRRLGLGKQQVLEVGSWRGRIARSLDALGRYRRRPGGLALVLTLSVGVQLLRVLQAYLLSEAMSLGTPLVYFLCFVPPILIVTMLPISVSGLGTTNVAYVVLFSQVGMDPDGAFVLSMLILALGVVGNLPGGVIYAVEGFAASESLAQGQNHGNIEQAGLLEIER